MNLKAPKIGSPFSSNTEEEKEALSQRLNLYKDTLDDQWFELKRDAGEYGKRAVVIGGLILGVFGVMNALLPDADEDIDPEEAEIASAARVSKRAGFGAPLAGAVQSLLWTVAVGWAKQKVMDFVVADKSAEVESEG